ncbi:MAG: hypothetical protein JWQ90_2727 [Hydrocarboniphaga sp.]|uniref:hypothetical protein n=1 Tax=Hydrocarboniphaga sp. TaxID=2033016 RepID=UPI0026035841|nr:hypothetical protein [Hydrocarboniphaga sp.]MDB5970277.1 hypothetical protein [Hydrocarboniphaga sp.]
MMRYTHKGRRVCGTGFRIGAASLAFVIGIASAAPGDDLSFIVHNHTGVDIKSLYVAPSQSGDWSEDDMLAGEPLYDGDDADISIPRGASVEKWDLRLVDRQGASLVWPAVDLSKTSEVTLRLNLGKPSVQLGDEEE